MTTKKPKAPAARESFIRIRMTGEFKDWLQRFADHRNLTISAAVVLAVIDDAPTKGFTEPAPKR